MTSVLALFAPVLMLGPAPSLDGLAIDGLGRPTRLTPHEAIEHPGGVPEPAAPVWASLVDAALADAQEQVRVERRVIVRISPRIPLQSEDAARAEGLDSGATPQFRERKMGKCVAIKSIVGVQISESDRLLLFMRDRKVVSAKLEKSCRSRDFYSGFYVENSDDGMICAERDTLHSRAGANCQVIRMRRLVPAGE